MISSTLKGFSFSPLEKTMMSSALPWYPLGREFWKSRNA
jgi:hypothetical protein